MQNIHPYFVHFPLALLAVGLLWDFLGVVLKKESFLHAGWWAQLFGVLAILAAAGTGLIAANTVAHTEAAHGIMESHQTIELIAAGLFLALFIWRSILKTLLPSKRILLVIYLIVATGAVATMLTGAHLGGKMVYEFGVGGSAVQQTESAEHHHHGSEASESSDTTKQDMDEHESTMTDTSGTHSGHHHDDDHGEDHKH